MGFVLLRIRARNCVIFRTEFWFYKYNKLVWDMSRKNRWLLPNCELELGDIRIYSKELWNLLYIWAWQTHDFFGANFCGLSTGMSVTEEALEGRGCHGSKCVIVIMSHFLKKNKIGGALLPKSGCKVQLFLFLVPLWVLSKISQSILKLQICKMDEDQFMEKLSLGKVMRYLI